MRQQLALSDFIFSVANDNAYQQLTRQSGGGWTNVERFGQQPLSQFTGLPLQTISLNGKVFGSDGVQQMQRLRAMQAEGKPYQLMDFNGNDLGQWKIMQIREQQKYVIDDGKPMVIEFTLELEEFVS